MSRALQLEFVAAAVEVGKLPKTRAEVAFVGRSNVGKSSLLNALAGGKQLARVSNTPGRTQVLACFRLGDSGTTLIDCPGYGYAKAPHSVRSRFEPMVEEYLIGREELQMVMLLVDGEIGPTKSDIAMLGWLQQQGLPHFVIATKQDQVKPSQRDRRQIDFAEKCRTERDHILWVSATKDVGIARLRELVRSWLL